MLRVSGVTRNSGLLDKYLSRALPSPPLSLPSLPSAPSLSLTLPPPCHSPFPFPSFPTLPLHVLPFPPFPAPPINSFPFPPSSPPYNGYGTACAYEQTWRFACDGMGT